MLLMHTLVRGRRSHNWKRLNCRMCAVGQSSLTSPVVRYDSPFFLTKRTVINENVRAQHNPLITTATILLRTHPAVSNEAGWRRVWRRRTPRRHMAVSGKKWEKAGAYYVTPDQLWQVTDDDGVISHPLGLGFISDPQKCLKKFNKSLLMKESATYNVKLLIF